MFVSSCAAAAAGPAAGSAIVAPGSRPAARAQLGEPLRPLGSGAQSSSVKQMTSPRAARAPTLRAAAGPAAAAAHDAGAGRDRAAAVVDDDDLERGRGLALEGGEAAG